MPKDVKFVPAFDPFPKRAMSRIGAAIREPQKQQQKKLDSTPKTISLKNVNYFNGMAQQI